MSRPCRIGILVSGGGSNAQAIFDACADGRIPADVVCVGSDNPEAGGLARASRIAVPTFVVDYREIIERTREHPESVPEDFDLEALSSRQKLFGVDAQAETVARFLRSRAAAERELLDRLSEFDVDVLVLAGFMRTLSPYFIDRFNTDPDLPRILNIHPALLPSFPGIDGYGDTFRHGCKVAGCTVHFIDYGEDSGPIIGQRAFPILPEDRLEDVKRKGLAEEWALYPESIRLYVEGRLSIAQEVAPRGGGVRKVVRITPS